MRDLRGKAEKKGVTEDEARHILAFQMPRELMAAWTAVASDWTAGQFGKSRGPGGGEGRREVRMSALGMFPDTWEWRKLGTNIWGKCHL